MTHIETTLHFKDDELDIPSAVADESRAADAWVDENFPAELGRKEDTMTSLVTVKKNESVSHFIQSDCPDYRPGARLLLEMCRRETMTYDEAVIWQKADLEQHQKQHGCSS